MRILHSLFILSAGVIKRDILDLFLRKSEKCKCRENEIFSFLLLEIFEIAIGLETVVPSTVKISGISVKDGKRL